MIKKFKQIEFSILSRIYWEECTTHKQKIKIETIQDCNHVTAIHSLNKVEQNFKRDKYWNKWQ